MRTGSRNIQQPFYRRNEQIRAQSVRVIDSEGKSLDVMDLASAKALAKAKGVDLVEIAPAAKPPVVKIIDYSKFLYQLKKKKRAEKRGTKTSETKQIRMTPFIGEHDLDIKLKKAREFLLDGDKVKFGVRFTYRTMHRKDLGRVVLLKIIEKLGDIAKVEREMHEEGRQLVMLVVKK